MKEYKNNECKTVYYNIGWIVAFDKKSERVKRKK